MNLEERKALLEKAEAIKKKMQRIKSSQAEKLKQIAHYEAENKMCYFGHEGKGYLGKHGKWSPNKVQQQFLPALRNPQYKVFSLTGANRISKTFSTTGIVAMTALLGRFPWEPESAGTWFWDMHGWSGQIKVRITGKDWEKHIKGVIIDAIHELWPKSWNMHSKKNSLGYEAFWTHPNGNTVEIMSNRSDHEMFAGWNGHVLIWDEPPREKVRDEAARGLMDNQGLEFFAMTMLGSERWVEDKIMNMCFPLTHLDGTPHPKAGQPHDGLWSVNVDINANLGFGTTIEGIEQFAATLSEDEKRARLHGIPLYKAGLILNVDRQKHIKNPEMWQNSEGVLEVPPNWLFDVFIDWHPSKPHAVDFFAIDEVGYRYVVFSYDFNGNHKAIVDKIVRTIDKYQLRVSSIWADPLSKSDKNNIETVYDKMENELAAYGYCLESAGKMKTMKDDGILTVNGWLTPKNEIPVLYFFRNCVKAIKQACDWYYDEQSKPAKVNDDHCENLYRYACLDRTYYDPEPESLEVPENRSEGSYGGY